MIKAFGILIEGEMNVKQFIRFTVKYSITFHYEGKLHD